MSQIEYRVMMHKLNMSKKVQKETENSSSDILFKAKAKQIYSKGQMLWPLPPKKLDRGLKTPLISRQLRVDQLQATQGRFR